MVTMRAASRAGGEKVAGKFINSVGHTHSGTAAEAEHYARQNPKMYSRQNGRMLTLWSELLKSFLPEHLGILQQIGFNLDSTLSNSLRRLKRN